MQTRVFDDFEAFVESVRGVDSKMLFRNPKNRIWSTSSVDLGAIDLQVGRLGSGNIAQGQLRSDGYMLYIPLTSGIEYFANGVRLSPESFAILEPGCEFCISTTVQHDWGVAFIPNELLDPSLSDFGTSAGTCRVYRPSAPAAQRFRSTLLQVFDAASTNQRFESSVAAQNAAAEILGIAKGVLDSESNSSATRDGRPSVPRDEVIKRAMDYIDGRQNCQIGVHELATAASVSERTLRTVFNEYFGVGPLRFLDLKHLHRVHHSLKEASAEETTVSQVLIDHGEWAFSRFAARYRELFGESPSDTLHRTAAL